MVFSWLARIFQRGGQSRSPGRLRNAYCSFCRKSYREAGPLVEGPDDVYICGTCIELCQSIIAQEKRRRRTAQADPAPDVNRFA